MHVLVIPSWYPQFEGDPGGSFFREQSIALSRRIDKVGVLFPNQRSLRELLNPAAIPAGIQSIDDQGTCLVQRYGFNWTPRFQYGIAQQWLLHGLSLFKRYVELHGMPNLLHAHSALYAGLLAKSIFKNTDIPYVITEHSTGYFTGYLSNWQIDTARSVFRSSTSNIAVSKSLAQLMTNQFNFQTPWSVIPNIVSEQFFNVKLAETLVQGEKKTKFVHVALLNPIKRQQLLIDAMKLCMKAGRSDLVLTIVGEGPERSALEHSVKSAGLEKQVFFTGILSRPEIPNVLANNDVFVLSSDYETFGVVVAEALAVGLHCIVTDCGGPVDIVEADDGVIVPRGDAVAIAKAMMEMADKPRDINDRIARRQRCANRFGEQAVCNSLIEHYCAITEVQKA